MLSTNLLIFFTFENEGKLCHLPLSIVLLDIAFLLVTSVEPFYNYSLSQSIYL